MQKQSLIILMNCAGLEIMRYLNNSKIFADKYDIEFFSSYELVSPDGRQKFSDACGKADVVLTQNIKKVEGLTYDEVVRMAKRSCHIIKIEYWRFNGFWPIYLPHSWPGFWFLPSEADFPRSGTFESYMATGIDRQSIKDHFESECERLHGIDLMSDIKIYPLFERSYINNRTFSDYNHPCSFFFHHVSNIILNMLGIDETVSILSDHGINDIRHRLILDEVYNTLDLKFDRDNICFFGKVITQKQFFDFSRFLMDNPPVEPALPAQIGTRFQEFFGDA